MKKWMKRHAVPVCVLLCIAILISVFISIRVSADAGNYEIRDIEGNASFLDGVTASMVLQDSAHVQNLTLRNGEMEHEYEYTMPIPIRSYHGISMLCSQEFVEHEDADVQMTINTQMEESNDTLNLYTRLMRRTADKVRVSVRLEKDDDRNMVSVQVITDVTVQDDSHPFVFNLMQEITEYKNQITPEGEPMESEPTSFPFDGNGKEITDPRYQSDAEILPLYTEDKYGRVYFTPSLLPYHGGQSAIYLVNEWGGSFTQEPIQKDGYEYYPWYEEIPVGSITKIATFPVDGHELRTVSLDVVDDRLCLLLVVDGMLTMRVYGLDGALQSETALFNYNIDYTTRPRLYTNKSGKSTMLCYRIVHLIYDADADAYVWDDALRDESDDILFCVELGKTVELRSVLAGHEALDRAAYIDRRWVLFESAPGARDEMHPAYTPIRYLLSVLDDRGETLYLGEIVTDINEDDVQYYMAEGEEWYRSNPGYTTHRWLYCDWITEDR